MLYCQINSRRLIAFYLMKKLHPGLYKTYYQSPEYMPYEKLSQYHGCRLQWQLLHQGVRENIPKAIKTLLYIKFVSPIKGYWYRFKYHFLKIPIVWYTGKNKGTFTLKCIPPTNEDKKCNMVWEKCVKIGLHNYKEYKI